MNAINEQNSSSKKMVAIRTLILIFIGFFGLVGFIVYFDLEYVFLATIAIVSFTLSVILLIRQKRISIHFIAALTVAFLFLVSSTIEFQFRAFTQNKPAHDPVVFSVNQVSYGLAKIGLGLASILVSFNKTNTDKTDTQELPEKIDQIQNYNILRYLQFGMGAIFLFLGAYNLIDGLRFLQ